MRFQVEIDGRAHAVVIQRDGPRLRIEVGDRTEVVDVVRLDERTLSVRLVESGAQHEIGLVAGRNGDATVHVGALAAAVTMRTGVPGARAAGAAADGPERIVAPMPGRVVKLLVAPGDVVAPRQGVVVVEAMKMENELRASRGGTVREVLVAEGASVEAGAPLVVMA